MEHPRLVMLLVTVLVANVVIWTQSEPEHWLLPDVHCASCLYHHQLERTSAAPTVVPHVVFRAVFDSPHLVAGIVRIHLSHTRARASP